MLENICSIILLFIRFFALSFTRATFHAIYRRFSAREFLKSLFGGWTFASFVLKYNSKYPRSILTAFYFFSFYNPEAKTKPLVARFASDNLCFVPWNFDTTPISRPFWRFSIMLGHFSRRKWKFCSLWAHSKYKTSKWKTNTSFKGKLSFAEWFVGLN